MARTSDGGELPDLAGAEWLSRPATRAVFAALTAEGAQARAVGGAVRNALMGTPVKDVDIATTALPDDVMRLAARAGLHPVPTGHEHGTITVVAAHTPFEVTTLRRDIETFGRHARVTYTTDWSEDAQRRDFTMNALYCEADGTVHDPLGGYEDVKARRVRFIGDARERIREDYLRTLRFFRFLAEYGDGDAPDRQGVAAAIAEKAGLSSLSGERVRTELLRLLAAPDATAALISMREADLLEPLLGLPTNVELVARLAAIERASGLPPDPLVRLGALIDGAEPETVQRKLRLSRTETERLAQMASRHPGLSPHPNEDLARAFIYRHGPEAFKDGVLLAWARSGGKPDSTEHARYLALPQRWQAPDCPVRGADLIARGLRAGPDVGRVLSDFESWWIAQGFPTDTKLVAAKLDELIKR